MGRSGLSSIFCGVSRTVEKEFLVAHPNRNPLSIHVLGLANVAADVSPRASSGDIESVVVFGASPHRPR